jgi:pimeloyl-ACP methyl ester carboxylesterase
MNIDFDAAEPFAAPSWALMGLEPVRAVWEYAGMQMMDKSSLPPGDGHPVVLFPGLASDKHAIGPLKAFCEKLGYTAYDWGRGFNTGPQGDPQVWLDELAQDIQARVSTHPDSISLVGWSLGGIYAREVAKRLPGRVRQVVTIGTPFAGSGQQTNAGLVYRLLNGSEPTIDTAMKTNLRTAPRVPTTSVYSRSDGVVPWQACIQTGGRADTENIQVSGSHCGLGWNSEVFSVLADRLSQAPGTWRPYASNGSSDRSFA